MSLEKLKIKYDSNKEYIYLGNCQFLKILYDNGNGINKEKALEISNKLVSLYNKELESIKLAKDLENDDTW